MSGVGGTGDDSISGNSGTGIPYVASGSLLNQSHNNNNITNSNNNNNNRRPQHHQRHESSSPPQDRQYLNPSGGQQYQDDSFRIPQRNPVLDSFVNDSSGFQDPSTALAAAESRCVGLVASAESFAQQRHTKLQQLFKKIQQANTNEVNDLAGRVTICESALQELSELLEQVQLHIGSATSATRDFIRTCTVERGKSEGKILSSLNSMLMRYEQERRTWRRNAAQHLIRQDLEGMGRTLENVVEILDDDDGSYHESTPTSQTREKTTAMNTNSNNNNKQLQQPHQHNNMVRMGFLALEEMTVRNEVDDENGESVNNAIIKATVEPKCLIRYMPEEIRQKRKTILQKFSQMLGQMMIDGDAVDRPFLLDAAYARVIRYADILTLHGETICRHIAEMFEGENDRRRYYLLDGERKIFHQQAEALCPPNLVPIENEPIYTVFVQQLVHHRLEREVTMLQMMDSGLEFQREQIQKNLADSAKKFEQGVDAIIATLSKHGVRGVASASQGKEFPDSSSSNNNPSLATAGGSSSATGGNSPGSSTIAAVASRFRTRTVGGFLGSTSAGGSITGGSGITEANVAAIVSKLLSASFGDTLAEPDSTDEVVRREETKAMQRVFFKLLQEVHKTISETHTKLSSVFDETIAAVQPSPINLINNETIFSLESLQSELAHQALLLKVASTNEGSERNRLTDLLKQEKSRTNHLQHDLDERTRQVIMLQAAIQSKDAEVHELDSAVKLRNKTQINIKNEIRKISYVMTSDAFGRGWQESVLLLRETMMKQLFSEQARLLARVKSYQKRKFDDQARIVELLEKGFLATSEQIEGDQNSRIREIETRNRVEMQRTRDECEHRVKNAHLDAQQEIKRSREMFEKMYFDRINELNESYDEKVRQTEQRQKDWEDRLWSKMKQIRQDFRDKEVATEKSYAAKHEAVLKIYEDESNTLKKNISHKEALLESERLSVHLEIERKINEGINKVKSNYESVRTNLQQTMLKYLEQQRNIFENQRQDELQLFSEFAFGGMQHAKDTAFGIVESNRKNFQQQVEDSQKAVQEANLSANDVSSRLLKHRDELHDKRLINIRQNNELVLRKTQLVRVEQDEKTWNNIHKEIVQKGAELDKKQADVEQLMAQRYIDIVKTLHSYIQGDVSATHQTFERECHFRQDQLRKYLNHFHGISLRIEAELWKETSSRNDIEREALSVLNLLKSRSRAEAEYVMRNIVIQSHVSTINENAEETTFTTVEALRARYEGLLRRQHQLMGAMSHDYVSSLQHYVAQQNTASEALSQVFSSRMDELHVAMRSRWELHWASRDMIVERRLEDLVAIAARGCPDVLGGALSLNRNGRRRANTNSPSRVHVLSDDDQQQNSSSAENETRIILSNNNNIVAAPPPLFYAQDVRVIEYFTKMRELLSKTFEDLDAKITAGLEERELKQRQHAIEMRARFLDAAAALTRRAEQLEDKVLDVKMANNSLQAQLQLKSESEIRAAILADDLKAMVAHYRLLTQNSMIHGAFTTTTALNNNNDQRIFASADSPLTSAGTWKRQHLLQQGKSTNVQFTSAPSFTPQNQQQQQRASSSPHSKKNSDQQPQPRVFQATFLLDVGGKRATRDVVSENALLRERLMANEWKNDRFLRDALLSSSTNNNNP